MFFPGKGLDHVIRGAVDHADVAAAGVCDIDPIQGGIHSDAIRRLTYGNRRTRSHTIHNDHTVAILIHGGDARIAVEHNGPLRRYVPM